MKTERPAGLYVHVPFCAAKCPYCDFYSVSSSGGYSSWVSAVLSETRLYRNFSPVFDTVYLGGGTPSVLPAKEVIRLIEGLRDLFRISGGAEITIEANPDDVTTELITAYRDAGFNRISLGVQSFIDGELAALGRRHGADEARKASRMVAEAGFDSFNIDLMHSLPGQSLREFEASLDTAVSINPDHISCYQLTIKEKTPFYEELSSGGLREASEEIQRRMFLFASEYLSSAGYQHYEVSSFAKDADARSRHNSSYWVHNPYLGLGPSAHSFDGTDRWWNVSSLAEYSKMLGRGTAPVEERETLTGRELFFERIMLGMRRAEGIEAGILREVKEAEKPIECVIEAGLAKISGERLVPTVEGLLMADQIAVLLLS